MGSISTVSSQTFKTYCFMAQKEGREEERRKDEEKEEERRGEGGRGGGGENFWEPGVRSRRVEERDMEVVVVG